MISLKSHGFKYSRPEANVVFDVSYFKNPWREKYIREEKDELKRAKKILAFMKKQDGVENFVKMATDLLIEYDFLFPEEDIRVAFCCSAGEYRSPAMVVMVAELLKRQKVGYKIVNKRII